MHAMSFSLLKPPTKQQAAIPLKIFFADITAKLIGNLVK